MKMPEWWRVRPGKRTLAALLVLILLAMAIYGGWRASGAADVGKPGKFTAKMLISNWRWGGWWSLPV